jgi:alkanesulfonate monooxygenase SsuD/methylene tetrahydromethanopterin reductase-like flavin-dependent oxidoreductase (luciferase family)
MKFGIFDHIDRSDLPLGEQYEARLKLIEAYDRAGFHAYHLAEHHATPLGMSPSPGVFLAAVAQRTRRLRFGPLVYTLSLYHPLRLAEEICMLDQLSGGRLELGVGRGVSPYETGYFGVEAGQTQPLYAEALEVILQALTQPKVNHAGKFFRFRDVPIELHPVQRPHPPLWYGVAKLESTEWTARHRVNIVCGGTGERLRALTDSYRAHWRAAGHEGPLPLLGMRSFVVVAETDKEALALARRAYRLWYASFIKLWAEHGARPSNADFSPDFDVLLRDGHAAAGAPETVLRTLAAQVQAGGVNYCVSRFAFGDLTLAESLRSLELYTRHVMPGLAQIGEASAK